MIQRKRALTHEFFDHQNIISFSAAATMRAADSAYTCTVGVGTTNRNADGSITVRREDFMGVNSCHGVVLMNAAFTGIGLGGSYLLHKMGRHKLERGFAPGVWYCLYRYPPAPAWLSAARKIN